MSEWGGSPPAYITLANELRGRIERGEYAPGAAIPSVSALIAEYGVSNSTVQTAVRVLKNAGLVESQRGKGVYVRRVLRVISRSADYTSPPEDGKTNYRAKSRQLEIAEVVPPDDVAQLLELPDDARAVRRGRVMYQRDKPEDQEKPVEIVASYFPVEIARGTELDRPEPVEGSTLSALKRLGYPPRHPAMEWVDARMPTADESRILRLPPGTPVLRLLRLTCTDKRRPIEVLDMVFGSDRYRLEYELPVHE
jgi:GntR family transcriptional regulator